MYFIFPGQEALWIVEQCLTACFFIFFHLLFCSSFFTFFGRFTWAVGFYSLVYYVLYYFHFIHKPNEGLYTRDEKTEREKKIIGRYTHYVRFRVRASSLWSVVSEPWSITDSTKRNATRTQRSRYIPRPWYKLYNNNIILVVCTYLYT